MPLTAVNPCRNREGMMVEGGGLRLLPQGRKGPERAARIKPGGGNVVGGAPYASKKR